MPALSAILAVIALLLAAGPTASEQQPRVQLTVRVVEPRPDPQDKGKPLGRRQWAVGFDLSVSADRTCDDLRYVYRATDLFDDRPGLDGSYAGGNRAPRPARSWDFGVIPTSANAGDTIALAAAGFCRLGATSFRSATVRLRVPIPPHSCDEGPLRVLQLRGRAWREDLQVVSKRVPLHVGHYIWESYTAWLGRGDRVVFGAPSCNRFRIALRGGRVFFPGRYQRHAAGVATRIRFGALARFLGDQHAGGIETDNASVRAAGRPSAPRRLASFEVYSYPRQAGRLTRVRVFRGTVWVRGSGAARPAMLVPSGYATTVRCASYRDCRPDAPHGFRPIDGSARD
jgi:hypothetical protein